MIDALTRMLTGASRDAGHIEQPAQEVPAEPVAEAQAPVPEAAPSAPMSDVEQARADERARFAAVLASPAYAGREALAAHLLGSTALDAPTIVAALEAVAPAAAPKQAAEPVAEYYDIGSPPPSTSGLEAARDGWKRAYTGQQGGR